MANVFLTRVLPPPLPISDDIVDIFYRLCRSIQCICCPSKIRCWIIFQFNSLLQTHEVLTPPLISRAPESRYCIEVAQDSLALAPV